MQVDIDRRRALRRIDDVLASDLSPEMAYPLRARLGRAVLEITRWFDQVHLGGTDSVDSSLANVVKSLAAISSHIMQPSEAFGAQWRGQWDRVIVLLRLVRDTLATMDS